MCPPRKMAASSVLGENQTLTRRRGRGRDGDRDVSAPAGEAKAVEKAAKLAAEIGDGGVTWR